MVRQLYRTQVLLEREQHEELQVLAATEGRSMSELIREAVAEYLAEWDEERTRQSQEKVLEKLMRLREAIRAESGEFPEALILNDRAERADELGQGIWGAL